MSVSKQQTRTDRKRRRQEPGRWFVLSIVLHVVAAAALVYFTPLRQILTEAEVEPERPETTMSSRQLDELADLLEAQTVQQVRRNIEQLRLAEQEMETIRGEIHTEFAAFERRQVEAAPAQALEAMEQAAEELRQAVEGLKAEEDSTRAIDRAQALAEQAQARALEKLAILRDATGDLAAKQAEAEALHQVAKQTEIRARQEMEQVERLDQQVATQQEQAEAVRARIEELTEAQAGETNEKAEAARAKDIQRQEERAARIEGEIETLEGRLEQARGALEATRAEAIDQEQQALDAQRQAVEAMRQRVEALNERARQQAATAAEPPQPRAEADPEAVAAMDVVDLYDHARGVEDEIAEAFKRVRAMDLAMIRDMTLAQAMNDIDVARPVRPDLKEALLRRETTSNDALQAQKREMAEALRQTGSMMDLAERMLQMANRSAADLKFGDDFALAAGEAAGVQVQQEQLLAIRGMASEDVSGDFVDVSGMMQAMAQGPGGQTGQAGEGALAGAGGEPGEDTAEAEAEAETEAGAEAEAVRPVADMGFDGASGDDGGRMTLTSEMVSAAARKVVASGEGADFVYLDTWYTLGPFPNPERVNIDREFPPDSLIDLDATYIGKDGRSIGWEFVQSDRPRVIPTNAEPYGIWYAYTEVYFDEPRDVVIAVGSDDRGVLRINGVPVWISGKRLKGWDIDEAWRKVHFQEGINRILFRVENGHHGMGFSLTMRLAE